MEPLETLSYKSKLKYLYSLPGMIHSLVTRNRISLLTRLISLVFTRNPDFTTSSNCFTPVGEVQFSGHPGVAIPGGRESLRVCPAEMIQYDSSYWLYGPHMYTKY